MGIRGIYKEIGAGKRIAFLRLAVESLQTRGRPLRLAIDISIWQFQVQAARGGANPGIRTLFYRLVRLLGMPVHPVFVFDGPNKPLFKRNKRSGTGDGMATAMAKRLIRLFGFVVHDAPGEAEAECALLQQRGVVDAVLSEDVDTLMFGCTRSLRNWSAAGKGATSPPTHISLYEADQLNQSATGLDREGMVLVALMSGGDYLPEGVPGCGVKLACEAARAGFGRSLCRLKRSDADAQARWRAHLQHELRSNESRFFRTCHHKLAIPPDFPSMDILRYYTHPVVSPADVVQRVRDTLDALDTDQSQQSRPVDIPGLRGFVAETFDWTGRIGAVKFVRVLAPNLLARMLLLRCAQPPTMVEAISKQRTHASTDALPELRVAFTPATVVGLDLDAEPDLPAAAYGRDGLALNSDDDAEEEEEEALPPAGTVAAARKTVPFDPTQPDVAWIAEALVQRGAPQAVAAWEEKQNRKKGAAKSTAKGATTTRSTRRRNTAADAGMQAGTLDRFVQVTKQAGSTTLAKDDAPATRGDTDNDAVEPSESVQKTPKAKARKTQAPPATTAKTTTKTTAKTASGRSRPPAAGNPWLLSGSQARVTKASASQLRGYAKPAESSPPPSDAVVVDLLSSPVEPVKRSPAPARSTRDTPSTGSPKRRRNPRTTADSQSPKHQTSILHFLSQPVTVVLSSDDEDSDRGTEAQAQTLPPAGSPLAARAKTVYVPRTSAVGYFREETVDAGETRPAGRRRGWRKSEVETVDLTGLK